MKIIFLWYSKSLCNSFVGYLSEEFKNGVTKLEQFELWSKRIYLRDAMEDVANTLEYILDTQRKKEIICKGCEGSARRIFDKNYLGVTTFSYDK